jgi:G3E family GTPase
MGAVTDVVLITGFLGSGKTTFLNRIIRGFPPDRKLMVLMNEFGEIGIDGRLVEGDDLDLLEISKGSIFCVCVKTDFIRGLARIAAEVQPDVLVIEATGVADPSDLERDLRLPLFRDRFRFKERVCIVDAENFIDAYDTFTSVEKQIESATLFVINKIDRVGAAAVETCKAVVARHHPRPEFYATAYADIPLARISPMFDTGGTAGEIPPAPSAAAVEAAIEQLLQNPRAGMTPPDRLLSAVYLWQGGSLSALRRAVAALPAGIVRAKGFVALDNRVHLFNRVMAAVEIAPASRPGNAADILNLVVFIGSPEAVAQLDTLLAASPDWRRRSP